MTLVGLLSYDTPIGRIVDSLKRSSIYTLSCPCLAVQSCMSDLATVRHTAAVLAFAAALYPAGLSLPLPLAVLVYVSSCSFSSNLAVCKGV